MTKYGTYRGVPLEDHTHDELCEIIVELHSSLQKQSEIFWENKLKSL